MRVLVIGPAFLDVVASPAPRLPEPGEELALEEVALAPGGFVIAAIALRRLGLDVRIAAPLAQDAPGDFLRRALAAEGVALEEEPCERTPTTIALNRQGDRGFLTAGFPSGDAVLRAGMRALGRGEGYAALHLSCRGPFARTLAEAAKERRVPVSMDCGTDPGWLQSDALREILALADVYLPNAREASLVTGVSDAREAARALAGLVPRAVVKLGADGVLCAGPQGVLHHPTERRPALDATGAGDVFDAGYIAGMLYRFDEKQAIRLGQYAAGLAIGRLGGAAGAPVLAKARAELPDLPWPKLQEVCPECRLR